MCFVCVQLHFYRLWDFSGISQLSPMCFLAGKTFQTLAYLGGLMKSRTIRNALVICPVSVLRTWEREGADILKKGCVPKATISVVSSDVKKQRRFRLLQEALDCPRKYPHLVITSVSCLPVNCLFMCWIKYTLHILTNSFCIYFYHSTASLHQARWISYRRAGRGYNGTTLFAMKGISSRIKTRK